MKLEKILPFFLFFLSSLGFSERKEKIEIEKSLGIKLIAPLLEGEESNTTNLRVEKKNILTVEKINEYLGPFLGKTKEKRKYLFKIRDRSLKNKRSLTTTFYGKKIFFLNGVVKTNIKLRARVYSTKEAATHFKRIKKLKHKFFLELKLKNASPKELNVSRKYRLLISDKTLTRLYQMDAKSSEFSKEWDSLEDSLASTNPKRTRDDIKKFLRIAKEFALIDPDFIKPMYVVQYSRVAYKFNEEYKPHGVFTGRKSVKNFEYQITMDRDVKIFEINRDEFFEKSLWKYVKEDLPQNLFYQYEKNVRVIEFKYPLETQERNYQKRSSCFKELKNYFAYPLFDYKNAYGNYKKNKGKLASAFRMLELSK